MYEIKIKVIKKDYGFKVPLPTDDFKIEYSAHRFNWSPTGEMTLMSKTGGRDSIVNSVNGSDYTKQGDRWVTQHAGIGLSREYGPNTLEYKAFEALSVASDKNLLTRSIKKLFL